MSEPTIEPTRVTAVVVAAVAGALGIGSILAWWQGLGHALPIPGFAAWASMLLIAVAALYLAVRTRRTLSEDPAALDPRQAVIRLLLGKTSLLAGAFLAGGYVALVLLAVPALPAPLAIERLVHGGIAAIAGVLCAVAGRRLENACRIPPPSGDSDANTPAR